MNAAVFLKPLPWRPQLMRVRLTQIRLMWIQAGLDYTFNKNVNGYILAEYFIPGDFYKVKDEALFLRTELQVKF